MGVVLAVRSPCATACPPTLYSRESDRRSQAPLSQQLQPKFLGLRQLFEARENASKMYSWPIFVITAIIVEIPFNIFACVARCVLSAVIEHRPMLTPLASQRNFVLPLLVVSVFSPPTTLNSLEVTTN